MWWVFGSHFSLNKKNCDFFAALRISGRKTAAEDTHIVPCVVIIGERASLWVIVLVAKLMNQKMSLEPGESHSCAELMRKKDFIFLVDLRENLNIGTAYISYVCVHATLAAYTH